MAYFSDAQDVYATLGKLFVEPAADEGVARQFRQADTIVQYEYTEPDAGPVSKILKLVPATKPIYPRYKAMLEQAGRSDLIEV